MKNDFKSYANSFQTVINLSLSRIEYMLELLENPQNGLRFIHVAGTNGKGSVCAFLQCICTAAGMKCGKYISPNLLKVNERISIDGKNISDRDLNRLLDSVEIAAEKTFLKLGERPSQFEIWTAAAMCFFKEQHCGIVILETGLGGRFDATNVVKNTAVSVICRIALDHMQYLGNTLPDIAFEKAGIIKPDSVVVTLKQSGGAAEVIEKVCAGKRSRLIVADDTVSRGFDSIYEIFDYKDIKNAVSGIGGEHQRENAALAIETALQLGIDKSIIKAGIAAAKNPGRFELIGENTLIDGAHNPNGALALKKSLDRYFFKKPKIYISGMMADKDICGMLKILGDKDSSFAFVTVADNPRAKTADGLAKAAAELGFSAAAYGSINGAYAAAKRTGRLIVVCGSLYLYKDFIGCINDVALNK